MVFFAHYCCIIYSFLLFLKMHLRFIILLCLCVSGCKEKNNTSCANNYYWAGTYRLTRHDTLFFCQKTIIRNDSFNLHCILQSRKLNESPPPPFVFTFNLKDKSRAFLFGVTDSDNISKEYFRYIGDTIINTANHDYKIYRYFFNEGGGFDAGSNYYWCPDIGIVKLSSLQGESRLYTNNSRTDSIIGCITEAIRNF